MNKKSSYLKNGLHIAVFLGLVWVIVKYVNGQEVLRALDSFKLVNLPIMILLAISYFLIKGARFVLLMRPFAKGIDKLAIYKGYMAGQAIAILPGGIAARAGLMNQLGVPLSQSSVPVAFHSGWDQVLLISGGLIAALWFPAARLPILIVLSVLLLLVLLLVLAPTRRRLAQLAEKIAARFDYAEDWQQFLEAVPQVMTKKIMGVAFIITVLAFGIQILVLFLTMRGMGLDVPLATLFLAFIVPTLLGRLVPVPGGFGVTEAGMVGFLTSTAQLSTNTTVAAVAIFRLATIVLPALLGGIVYYFFWQGEAEVQAAAVSES